MEAATIPHQPVHKVFKFGGEAMCNIAQIGRIIEMTKGKGETMTLVVSAFKDVTDTLYDALDQLTDKDYTEEDIDRAFEKAKDKHAAILVEFTGNSKEEAQAAYNREFERLKLALMLHKEISNVLRPVDGSFGIRDHVIGFGERMSAKWLEIYLKQQQHQAHHIDDVSCSLESYGEGPVSISKIHRVLRDALRRSFEVRIEEIRSGVIHIVGGHIGGVLDQNGRMQPGTPRGIADDVDRGYTDPTAENTAIALEEIDIDVQERTYWKAEDGFMSIDPRDLEDPKKARLRRSVSITEATEAASKLINLSALGLAGERGDRLTIRNFNHPDREDVCTTLSNAGEITDDPFKTIASNPRVDLVSIDITGMANGPGFLSEITRILAKHGHSIEDAFTSHTSVTFSVSIPKDAAVADEKRRTLGHAIQELKSVKVSGVKHDLDAHIQHHQNLCTIAVVGDELRKDDSVIHEISGILNTFGYKPIAITHTPDKRRLSLCFPQTERLNIVRFLHKFYIEKDQVLRGQYLAKKSAELSRHSASENFNQLELFQDATN